MTVVGFSFTKINVERKQGATGRLNINNNLGITKVEKANLNFGKADQDALKVSFEFTAVYEPDAGKILLGGELIDIEDEKTVKAVLEQWKKEKKVPQQVMARILNTVLNRCNVQALILSRDINLPPPIPLPRVNVQGQPQPGERVLSSPKRKTGKNKKK